MRRGDPGRGGNRQRRWLGGRGRTGLLSAIAPVAVGVALAFTWNVAGSHALGTAGTSSAVTPEVEMTVEQAATQVWASTSPLTVVAGAVAAASPQVQDSRDNGTGSARHAHRVGRQADSGCPWPRRPARAVVRVRVMLACSPRPHGPRAFRRAR